MIKIKILSGPYVGKEGKFEDGMFEGVYIHPLEVLTQLWERDDEWQIDFSQATPEEAIDWVNADIKVRTLRALTERRPVFFLGEEYRALEPEDITRVEQQIDNVIVASGYYISLERDDQTGVYIGYVNQHERPLH